MNNLLIKLIAITVSFCVIFSVSPVQGLGSAKTIKWKTLRHLNYKTGQISTKLKSLNFRYVRLPGFVVPLDGDENRITSFLLVPTLGACIHVPPPPPNQTVLVEMEKGLPAKYVFQPVWITGQFLIVSSKQAVPGTPFVPEASFKIVGMEAKLYEM